MSTPPLKDFFASPALSLSLAGVFRNAEAVGEDEVEEGETESGGGCQRGSVDISSENTGPGRSEEDGGEKSPEEEDGEIDPNNKRKKRRKKYHRHTAEQIREMEALFRESPHPDEKQREQLSKHLGLAPRQVKFWFQNRRTQIKAIQERHENSLLKSEIDNLREENQRIRESIKNACCPSCSGSTASSEENGTITGERLLRIENMRLKSEVEKLQEMIGGKQPRRSTSSPSPSYSTAATTTTTTTTTMELDSSRSCLDNHGGVVGPEKSRIAATAAAAMDELMKMATAGEPLWVRSVETGRDILNYDEYAREFARDDPNVDALDRRCEVEASRETGSVILDVSRLTRAFMDVNQWKDMFPGLVSKASIVDVISDGEPNGGVMQLMFAELQLLTPMVPAREVYFVRYCKQQSPEKWAVVDVSVDIDASINLRCRKRPSGCIIEDKANGHCKITWVEHVACQRIAIPSLFRPIISTGLAFGARHWMAALQQQCERQVFSMATNVPAKGTIGVPTTMGRKSVLSLAQRMTCGFCRVVGATSNHVGWKKIPVKCGADDMSIFSRKNLNDPGEPIGVILCAASSAWLPVSPHDLFGFLTDDSRRKEWDIMFNATPTDTVAYLAKGQDRGNSITIHGMGSDEKGKACLLQDRCTNGFESTLVFAPADVNAMKSAIAGCDSGKISILPSGFSILPDGMETRPQVIRSRKEGRNMEGGSMLTFAVQILADSLPLAEVTMDAVDTTCSLVSCILRNVKRAMQCEDGS